MAIFENLRGLVPLPKSRRGNSTSDVNSSVAGVSDEIFSPEFPLPLPDYNQPDVSNTFMDNIYTRINDVFEYIHLPTPENIQGLYSITQKIEGIIEDPISFVRNTINQEIYKATHSTREAGVDEVIDLTTGIKGLRASLVEGITLPQYDGIDNNDTGDFNEQKLVRTFLGRDSVKDITLRSLDLWDIKIEPYEHNEVENEWVPPFNDSVTANINSTGMYQKVYPKSIPKVTDYMPILSYNLDLKTLTTKQLELFGGSSISVPDLIRYTSHLSIQIVDDENKRWRRWFQKYSENLYDSDTNSVAPYKNSSLQVSIYQYRQDHKVLSYNKYICSLMNYQMLSSGAGDASTDVLDIELSIVGKVDLDPTFSYLEIV
jgi:hypothetical protein